MGFLPETMFGMDTDDVLAYATPKVAYVRDRYIGALYYSLTLLALCWVIGGQVLWRNEHFMVKDVKGISRMLLTHPTKGQCDPNDADCLADFKSLSELPYCKENEGGAEVKHAAPCQYADRHSMFPDGTVGSQVFIPTSSVVMEEKKHCQPNATNKFMCENEYKKTSWGGEGFYLNETNMQYYANIEDYTVQFTSTYHRGGIAGTSLDHPGFFLECSDKNENLGKELTWQQRLKAKQTCDDERRLPIDCMPGMGCVRADLKTIDDVDIDGFMKGESDLLEVQVAGVQTSRRSLRNARKQHKGVFKNGAAKTEFSLPTPPVFASTWGDTFKLGKLMQLAQIDLDRHYNMDNVSARMAGTIIEVEVSYSNLQKFLSSFGLSQVQYDYKVKERKLPYVSREILHPEQPKDFPKSRRYLVQHGILLDFKVSGEFGFFSIVYLLIMLTTSMALLATAHKVTDLTSLYLHPRKNNYFHLKYEVSGDFSDMWECEQCAFFNNNHEKTCKGIGKWMSAIDTPYCGHARPSDWQSARPDLNHKPSAEESDQ